MLFITVIAIFLGRVLRFKRLEFDSYTIGQVYLPAHTRAYNNFIFVEVLFCAYLSSFICG